MHEDILHLIDKITPTGSRVICNPAPTDTDQDFVVLLKPADELEVVEDFQNAEYDQDGDETYDILYELGSGGWASFRKGDLNYIVTFDEGFYNRFVMATDIAKDLNLLNKPDRVTLFKYILYKADLEKEF